MSNVVVSTDSELSVNNIPSEDEYIISEARALFGISEKDGKTVIKTGFPSHLHYIDAVDVNNIKVGDRLRLPEICFSGYYVTYPCVKIDEYGYWFNCSKNESIDTWIEEAKRIVDNRKVSFRIIGYADIDPASIDDMIQSGEYDEEAYVELWDSILLYSPSDETDGKIQGRYFYFGDYLHGVSLIPEAGYYGTWYGEERYFTLSDNCKVFNCTDSGLPLDEFMTINEDAIEYSIKNYDEIPLDKFINNGVAYYTYNFLIITADNSKNAKAIWLTHVHD